MIYQLITGIRPLGPRTPQTLRIGWVNVPPSSSRRTLTAGYTDRSGKELQAGGCGPLHSTFMGGTCFHSLLGVTGSIRQVHTARDEPRAMPSPPALRCKFPPRQSPGVSLLTALVWKEGIESRSRLCAEPFPHHTHHPSPPQYHRQMTARQTRTFRTPSQESITQQMKNRCFTSFRALLNGV